MLTCYTHDYIRGPPALQNDTIPQKPEHSNRHYKYLLAAEAGVGPECAHTITIKETLWVRSHIVQTELDGSILNLQTFHTASYRENKL